MGLTSLRQRIKFVLYPFPCTLSWHAFAFPGSKDESLMRLFQTRNVLSLPITVTLEPMLGPEVCVWPAICLLLNECQGGYGRDRKWSWCPRYLGNAGNSGLTDRMAHFGGEKGHGAKFTTGQTALLVPDDKGRLWSSEKKTQKTMHKIGGV